MHDEPSGNQRSEWPHCGHPADLGRPVARTSLVRSGAAPPRHAFRPGVTPHPDRVAGPHAPAIETMAAAIAAAPDDASRGACCLAAIGLGADLHDGGWWWEAHEAWEIPWRTWPREDPRARLLQALIQDAAAWLQLERGRPRGVRRLLERSARNRELAVARGPDWNHWLGLDHLQRHRDVAAYLERCRARCRHEADAFPPLPLRFPAHGVS